MIKPQHIWLKEAKTGDMFVFNQLYDVNNFRGYAARRGVKIKAWAIKRSGVKQWRVKIL